MYVYLFIYVFIIYGAAVLSVDRRCHNIVFVGCVKVDSASFSAADVGDTFINFAPTLLLLGCWTIKWR